MKRGMLTWMLALIGICGCAGRMNVDLLQARIRQQEAQIAESQRQIAKTQSELKQSQLEAQRLKSELSHSAQGGGEVETTAVISRIKINPLASGGLNQDDLPGDDTVIVQFAPLDSENQPVKVPGDLELVLIDPQLPAAERQIGRWDFTSDDCQTRWTRGITSSGFQFSLPLEQLPTHTDLVVQLQFTTPDSRRYLASQRVKVTVAPGNVSVQKNRLQKKPVQVVEETDDLLPPVGDQVSNEEGDRLSDWDRAEPVTKPLRPGHSVLHSANWTDATIPVLR